MPAHEAHEAHDEAWPRQGGRRPEELPALFVLVEDPHALSVLLEDLSRRFGRDFAVGGEHSPRAAMAALERMASEGPPVALMLVDGGADGVLARAHELHPRAKRVLLVDRDYSSTSPAVRALTLGRADFHLVRPWADDEMMYRAMSEYLSSWTREQEPRFELFRIIGRDGDARVPHLRDVMTRMSMPWGFYPADGEEGRRLLAEADLDATSLPVVVSHDGQVMADPSMAELAEAFGVRIDSEIGGCEVAIVGAGPAGLAAAVYGASEGLETVLLDRSVSGGQAGTSPMIRNYPGFPHGIEGGLLMERTCEQAWLMGARIAFTQEAVALERDGEQRVVTLRDGSEIHARAIVVATGIEWRRLGVPRLEALVGAGVHYGAAAGESRLMEGQDVFVVGAGNSAGQAALHLAKYARSVTLLVRGESFARSMSSYLVDGVESAVNVTVSNRTEVVDGYGRDSLEGLELCDRSTGRSRRVRADALFIMIGGEPHTGWLPPEIARSAEGYLLTGSAIPEHGLRRWRGAHEPMLLETSMPGVFAAGDVRQGAPRRVASAVGEGATVVRLVHEYLAAAPASPVKAAAAA